MVDGSPPTWTWDREWACLEATCARQSRPRQAGEVDGIAEVGSARPGHDWGSVGCGCLRQQVAGVLEIDESPEALERLADRGMAGTVHDGVHCTAPGTAWAGGQARRMHWGLDRAVDCSSCRSLADMLDVDRTGGIG